MFNVVNRTRYFNASMMGYGLKCRLRCVLEIQPEYEPELPRSPAAHLGSLVHRILEEAYKSGIQNVVPLIQKAIAETTIPSNATLTGEVTLNQAVRTSFLLRRVSVAQRSLSEARPLPQRKRPTGTARKLNREIRGPISIPEKTLRSDSLQLIGQLDRLDLDESQNATITDYKTGNLLEESGEVREHYRIQMMAYGLLVSDALASQRIRLKLVGLDGTLEWSFDDNVRSEIRNLLASLTQSIPKDVDLVADKLATFGEACRYCRYRPECKTYREAAPAHWNDPEFEWLPLDTWGVVERINADKDVSSVYLMDQNGFRVSIRGVPNRFVRGKQRAEFFNLRPLARTLRSRPANFYIVNEQRSSEAAHEAVIRFT